MTAVVRCGDPECPCQRLTLGHRPESPCACGCGQAHCAQCGEVWPCTTETGRRYSVATETGDPA